MANNSSEPTPQPAGGLQSMLARLRGMVEALKSPADEEKVPDEVLPTFDGPEVPAAPPAPAMEESPPLALPVGDGSPPSAPVVEPAAEAPPAVAEAAEALPAAPPVEALKQLCPYCQAPRNSTDSYCGNCGWVF